MLLLNRILIAVALTSTLLTSACGHDADATHNNADASVDAAEDRDTGLSMDMGDETRADMPSTVSDMSLDGDMSTSVLSRCDAPLDFATLATRDGSVMTYAGSSSGSMNALSGECGGDEGTEVVFAYTPTVDGLLNVDTIASTYDTILYVRTACNDVASEIDCNDDRGRDNTSVVKLPVARGVPVFIVVDSYRGAEGWYVLHVSEEALVGEGEPCDPLDISMHCNFGLVCAPAEPIHTCQRTDLGCGLGVPVFELEVRYDTAHFASDTTRGSDMLESATMCGGVREDSDREIVHHFQMPFTGKFTIETHRGLYSDIIIRTGTCDGTEVFCTSTADVDASDIPTIAAGTDVYVIIDGWVGHSGPYLLDINFFGEVGESGECGTTPGSPFCAPGLVCREEATLHYCRVPACNDGLLEGDEECEDGNLTAGDGCSASCLLEAQGPGGDTCATRTDLTFSPIGDGSIGAHAVGDTTGATSSYSNRCILTDGAPDVVYAFTLTENSDVHVNLLHDPLFLATATIRGGGPCELAASELICIYPRAYFIEFDRVNYAPGTYYIIINGDSGDGYTDHGAYELYVTVKPHLEM